MSANLETHGENESLVQLDKFPSFWFNLSPQMAKKEHSYPKLKYPYINIKNTDLSMPVSVLQKYLMEKLNLENENEIEICCLDEPLSKDKTLRTVYQMWVESMSKTTSTYSIGASAEGLVMQLIYKKKIKD